jgi:glucosaminylphosphatidylinositol acyltransferase
MGALAAVCMCQIVYFYRSSPEIRTAHQVVLSFGMRDYVLLSPRTNLLTANKEGIVSLMGYFSIHLFGLSTGTMILPPSPSHFRRQQHIFNSMHHRDRNANVPVPAQIRAQRENDKTAVELCSYTIIWWACLGLSSFFKIDYGVSRRLVRAISPGM